MASYTQLYLHCVWATWDRLPLIVPEVETPLYSVIADKCREFICTPMAIGGIDDHIHVLVRLSPMIAVARLVGEIKGASSHAVTHTIRPAQFFKWHLLRRIHDQPALCISGMRLHPGSKEPLRA